MTTSLALEALVGVAHFAACPALDTGVLETGVILQAFALGCRRVEFPEFSSIACFAFLQVLAFEAAYDTARLALVVRVGEEPILAQT